jgi:acyl-coenzyme A thioesterase PaaI-like protein
MNNMAELSISKANRELWLFGLLKIPMIFYCRPRIVAMDYESVTVMIPLRRRTRNHLGSMYFGALAVGADIAGGFLAFTLARQQKLSMSLAFGSFQADFLKRPESDVYFHCQSGALVAEMFETSQKTGERQNRNVSILAYTLQGNDRTEVATFELGLSIKVKMKS